MSVYVFCWFFFFFQAEDGIRDWSVTGVQTCALPISQNAARSSRIVMSSEPPRRMLPPPMGRSGGWSLLLQDRGSPSVAEVHAVEHRLGALHRLGDLGHVLGDLGVDLGEEELVEGLVGPDLEPVLVHVLADGELP